MSKIKPFYVYKPTRDEAVEIVERAWANGADCEHSVFGMGIEPNDEFCDYNKCKYWGVDGDNQIAQWVDHFDYGESASNLTMPEVREMLPCEKYDGDSKEWPKPGDEVTVSCGCFWPAIFIGEYEGSYVCRMPDGYPHGVYDGFSKSALSKPRTARDNFIERVIEIIGNDSTTVEDTLGRMFDAGLVKDFDE